MKLCFAVVIMSAVALCASAVPTPQDGAQVIQSGNDLLSAAIPGGNDGGAAAAGAVAPALTQDGAAGSEQSPVPEAEQSPAAVQDESKKDESKEPESKDGESKAPEAEKSSDPAASPAADERAEKKSETPAAADGSEKKTEAEGTPASTESPTPADSAATPGATDSPAPADAAATPGVSDTLTSADSAATPGAESPTPADAAATPGSSESPTPADSTPTPGAESPTPADAATTPGSTPGASATPGAESPTPADAVTTPGSTPGASATPEASATPAASNAAALPEDLQQGVGFQTDFSTIDISRTEGNGQACLAAAEAVCPANGDAKESEDKRRASESAELTLFNPAIDAAKRSGDKKKEEAVLCQQVRNKVLKSACFEVKNTVEGNAAKAEESKQQKEENIKRVDEVCANVDPALFIDSAKKAGKGGSGDTGDGADVQNDQKAAKQDVLDAAANAAADDNDANQNKGAQAVEIIQQKQGVQKEVGGKGGIDPATGEQLEPLPEATDFCKSSGMKIADGSQIKDGFCSSVPQGQIPNVDKMTSTMIVSPENGATLQTKTDFNVDVVVSNLNTGFFTRADLEYYTQPQTLNAEGVIRGHVHITIQKLNDGKRPPKGNEKAFFKGVNDKADANGFFSVPVGKANITEPGLYRICTLAGSFSHQPVIMPIAQRGSQDDCIRVNFQ